MSIASSLSKSVEPTPRRWSPFEISIMESLGFFEGDELMLVDRIVHRRTGSRQTTPRRWTRREYYAMGERGLFQHQRVQLIDGEIVLLSPQRWPHAATIGLVAERLAEVFGEGFWVREQLPLGISNEDEPEPDVSVVRGRIRDYSDHPTTAVLVVEVSWTALAYDRDQKAALYARAKIQDYWIVNLVDHQVEIHREPVDDSSTALGARYAQKTVASPEESLTPLAAPRASIAVSDLRP
jgi:Uma2 family endonuclease